MKKIEKYLGVLVFLISFTVYLKTLCPTVYVGDSGELIAAAYTLGIPHPPGYPLFTILGKVFITLIPIGSIAYRVNLLSAFFASSTVMVLYFFMLKLVKGDISFKPKKQ
jgi:hypothetical protein